MKKSLILLCIIFLLTGCGKTSKKELSLDEQKDNMNKRTICSQYNLNEQENDNNISSYMGIVEIYYNTLDDDTCIYQTNIFYTFDTWNDAKSYYDVHKNDYGEGTATLSEENIDTNSTGDIRIYFLKENEKSPREIIETLKEGNFECDTRDNKEGD